MFEFLEDILLELKDVPGLSFLKRLHYNLHVKRQRIATHAQNVRNRSGVLVKYSKSAAKVVHGSKGSKSRDN